MRDLTNYYKKILVETANLSYCKKRKVGSIIVKDGNIISFGYNGTPPGQCNDCEDTNGKTKPDVLHAEFNAIAKAARQGFKIEGADIYNTLSPCYECAKLIIASGIKRVYFMEQWENDPEIIVFLEQCGVQTFYIGDF